MNQSPDYLMIFFSIVTMILVAVVGFALLSSCAISYHKRAADTEGKKTAATDFVITTKS